MLNREKCVATLHHTSNTTLSHAHLSQSEGAPPCFLLAVVHQNLVLCCLLLCSLLAAVVCAVCWCSVCVPCVCDALKKSACTHTHTHTHTSFKGFILAASSPACRKIKFQCLSKMGNFSMHQCTGANRMTRTQTHLGRRLLYFLGIAFPPHQCMRLPLTSA